MLCAPPQVANVIGTTVDQVWASLRYIAKSGKMGDLGLSTARLMEALDIFERGRHLHKLLSCVPPAEHTDTLLKGCKTLGVTQMCGYRYLAFYQ